MANHENITINFPGGIISPGHLYDLMEIATAAKVSQVRFGNRQELFLEVSVKHASEFRNNCRQKDILCNSGDNVWPNIVSSYAAEGIFINDTWLSEGVYKDVLGMFDFEPRLKVNICDGDQTFVPLFDGNINWIASTHQNFWYLYIRYPKTNILYRCPDLIYTNDIVYVTKAIEEMLISQSYTFFKINTIDGNNLYEKIKQTINPVSRPVEQDLKLPEFHLPYYEGFNRHGKNYWLGIYRRNEMFSVSFLKDLSRICMETNLGEIYCTTWKSVIIKSIDPSHRKLWDQLLGKYRINVRHAANELNWNLENLNEDALILKRHVIRHFDKEDVRTYGICFAVRTRSQSGIFGSVIIRNQAIANRNRLKSQERFEILYTRDFNPNSPDYILFRDNVKKEYLGTYLVSICKLYYESRNSNELIQTINPIHTRPKAEPVHHLVYQCKHCLSVYDQESGDPENDIVAGTAFDCLPAGYSCRLCDSPLSDFVAVYIKDTVSSSLDHHCGDKLYIKID